MQVQNIDGTNFNGGYKVTNLHGKCRKKFLYKFRDKTDVYYDFKNNNDILIVADKELHPNIAAHILYRNFECKYFPQLTKRIAENIGADNIFDKLDSMLSKNLTMTPEIQKIIDTPAKVKRKESFANYTNEDIMNIIEPLHISVRDPKFSMTKGVIRKIEDNSSRRNIYITPPDKDNKHYVIIRAMFDDVPEQRFSVNPDTKEVKKYSYMELKSFNEKFNSAVK